MHKNYFEFSWLIKKGDDFPLPKLIFIKNHKYSGSYIRPNNKEYYVNEQNIYNNTGILFIGDNGYDDVDILGTIAHEWRHHWQYFNGKLPNREQDKKKRNTITKNLLHEEQLFIHFAYHLEEIDALLYCLKNVPKNSHSVYFLDILMNGLQKRKDIILIRYIEEMRNA